MFEGLKKLWREAKECAKDDGVIRMPPAVFENEHETTSVNLSQKSDIEGKLELVVTKPDGSIESLGFATEKTELIDYTFKDEPGTYTFRINKCKPGEIGKPCPPLCFGDEQQGTSIDTEIAALVAEMNRVGIHTTCSCQGHEGGEAYVSIRLGEGTTYEHRKDIFGPGQDELTLRWRRK